MRLNAEGFLKQRVSARKWDVAKLRQKFPLKSFYQLMDLFCLVAQIATPQKEIFRRNHLRASAHPASIFGGCDASLSASLPSLPRSHGATDIAACREEATGRAVALTWLLRWE